MFRKFSNACIRLSCHPPVLECDQPPKVVMCRGFNGSVFEIPELGLARRPYRLVVLDPPFGWNLGGAEWDKKVSFLLVVLCPFLCDILSGLEHGDVPIRVQPDQAHQ